MTTEIRHTNEKGTVLNETEKARVRENIRRLNQREVAFADVIGEARQWSADHNPFDRTTKLPLFQYVIEEGTGGALVPFKDPNDPRPQDPGVGLLPHAHGQLLSRLDFAKRTFEKLPPKLQILNLNWLIQNHYDKEVLLRIIDENKVRALMSADFEPFDDLELLTIAEPYIGDGTVRWYHTDDQVLHLSITWPNTEEEIRVGDVVQTGLHISNSEVGLRSVTIAGVVWRLKCSNALIGGGEGGGMRRFRHVGDTNKLRDQVKATIEETKLESTKVLSQFKASLEKAIDDPFNYLERVAKDKTNEMTQDDFKAAMDAFLTEPENTLFGVTNSLTRAAQGYQGEDKYHLERVAAKVLNEGLRK